MKLQGPILVGTDFSAASEEALRQGNDLANDLGTGMIVCHVVPELDTVDVLFPQLAARNAEHRGILISRAMAGVERQVADRLGDGAANVKVIVDSGTPHAGLLTQADVTGAGLIVLGPGRTADRVVRHATVPTLIARHSPHGVVIGTTDFSDPSLPALEAAAAEAHRRASRLQLLHVVDVGTYALGGAAAGGLPFVHGTPGISLRAMDDLQMAARNRLREALIGFAVDGEATVKTGAAAQTIVDLVDSARAELVVVGTNNPRNTLVIVEIAAELPSELGVRLAPRLVRGITPAFADMLSDKLGKLMAQWATHDATAAVMILRAMLTNYGTMAKTRPFDGMAEYLLAETIQDHMPAVLRAASEETIAVLIDALKTSLEREMHFVSPSKPEDYSEMWRPSIAHDGYHHRYEFGNTLVTAVRGAIIAHLEATGPEPNVLHWIEMLEAREWHIFKRLAMHVASVFPEQAAERLQEWLLDRAAFDSWSPDYAALFARGYQVLAPEARTTLLDWIVQGTDVSQWSIDEHAELPQDEQRNRMLARWKAIRLSAIRDHLDESSKRTLVDLTALGGASPSVSEDTDDSGWIGPKSPLTVQDLRDVEQLVSFLREWVPPGGWRAPTPDGLSRTIAEAAAKEPARFAAEALRFVDVEPTYVRGVIDGFREALKGGSQFEWEPILRLSAWAVQQPREAVGIRGDRERDPGWSWTHRAVASLLREGLDTTNNRIPCNLRTLVWKTIEPLTRDPDPTPTSSEGEGPSDWFATAINSTRGEAIIAAIRYGVWLRKCVEAEGQTWSGLASTPELAQVLEVHLEPETEGSAAIAAVYGQALQVLAYLDEPWLESQLERIFPTEPERRVFRMAAWDAYLRFGDSWLGVLRFGAALYEDAIDALDATDQRRPPPHEPAYQLAHDVMEFFWNSSREQPRLLAERLFARAGPGMRAAALDIVGRSVGRWLDDVPAEVYQRLRRLWDAHVNVAHASATELGTFGSWLISDRFDREWALPRAMEILRRGVSLDSSHRVAEFAARNVAPGDPLSAVRLVEGLLETETSTWSFVRWGDATKNVLQTALAAQQPEAVAAARVLISKLVARGHAEYKNLLEEDPESRNRS